MNCCCLLSEVAVSKCFLCCEVLDLFMTSGIHGLIHPAVAKGTKKVLSRRPGFIDHLVFWWTHVMCWQVVVLRLDDGDH